MEFEIKHKIPFTVASKKNEILRSKSNKIHTRSINEENFKTDESNKKKSKEMERHSTFILMLLKCQFVPS